MPVALENEGLGNYSAEVDQLKVALLERQNPHTLGNYLPGGRWSFVFRTQDERSVIKIPLKNELKFDEPTSPRLAQTIIGALDVCRGVSDVEQLVAWDLSGEVPSWITRFAEGEGMDAVDPQTIGKTALEALIKAIRNLYDRDVLVDDNPRNFLYDGKDFTIIDYLMRPAHIDPEVHMRQTLQRFSRTLFPGLKAGSPASHGSAGEKTKVPEKALVFRALSKEHLGSATAQSLTDNWLASNFEVPDGHRF